MTRVMELVDTSSGCTTFSSRMFVMAPFHTLIPIVFSPWACLHTSESPTGLLELELELELFCLELELELFC